MVKTRHSIDPFDGDREKVVEMDSGDGADVKPRVKDGNNVTKENNSNKCNSAAEEPELTQEATQDDKGEEDTEDDSDASFEPSQPSPRRLRSPKHRRKTNRYEFDDDYSKDDSYSTQGNVRRSGRERKQMYHTMNEQMIESTRRQSTRNLNYQFRGSQTHTSRSQASKRSRSSSDSEMTSQRCSQPHSQRDTRRTKSSQLNHSNQSQSHLFKDEDEDEGDMYTRVKNRRVTRTSGQPQINHNDFEDESTDEDATEEDELGETLRQDAGDGIQNGVDGDDEIRRPVKKRKVKRRELSSDDEEDKLSLKKGYALRNRPSFTMIQQIQQSSPLGMKRPKNRHQRRRAAHNSSSSSSDGSSSDESSFERKKASKLAKARSQCLPLNMKPADLLKGALKDRIKVGSSLADIEPMAIDTSITFESIGGLGQHINSLKEMVLFPLLYPEVFERFKVQCPRGVLFFGPPGTGKTLVARALANECSTNGKKVAFFMRKGADCMSKWVGESERQLRLLFDQAYLMRPSIIFFDEIDGIAPVRSTRQDQIHSSIVSTLLALMDGLDSRGEVIVIGATNRIEAIDPALRRPGRFDREFYFPLPSFDARKCILDIHTKAWNPRPDKDLIDTLAAQTIGYCGADLKALCSEAVLLALRRRYKQIYNSRNKLKLDLDAINVTLREFKTAINRKIIPAAQRSLAAAGSPLPLIMRPLLDHIVADTVDKLKTIFSIGFQSSPKETQNQIKNSNSDSEDDELDESYLMASEQSSDAQDGSRSLRYAGIFRPRLVICGQDDYGQEYVARSIINQMEQVNCLRLDGSKVLEQVSDWFSEVSKRLPLASVIYVPNIDSLEDSLYQLLVTLLNATDATIPLLLVATTELQFSELELEIVNDLFKVGETTTQVVTLNSPKLEDRSVFFGPLLKKFLRKPIKSSSSVQKLEVLEEVSLEDLEPRKLSDKELKKIRRQEEAALRELRLFLRDCLAKLTRDKRFGCFLRPVDPEDVPDYHLVIKNPMDLEMMMFKIDSAKYESARQFLDDIELICDNALEYNSHKDSQGRQFRHRACLLRDQANAIIEADMQSDFENYCQEIHQNRIKRNESPNKDVPDRFKPQPATSQDEDHNQDGDQKQDKKESKIESLPKVTPATVTGSQNEDTEIESNAEMTPNKICPSGDQSATVTNGNGQSQSPIVAPSNNCVNNNISTCKKSHKKKPKKGSKSHSKPQLEDMDTSEQQSVLEPLKIQVPSDSSVQDELELLIASSKTTTASSSRTTATTCETTSSEPAATIQEEVKDQQVVIDESKLDYVTKLLLKKTEGFTVAKLEKLYWSLFRIIRNREKDVNKEQLLNELESEILNLVIVPPLKNTTTDQ